MENQLADDTISLLPRYKFEAKDKDTATPPDFTTSPAMTDAEDTQPSPMETPLAAKPDTGIQKDLPAAQSASPTKLEDPLTPTAVSMDKLACTPTLASHMVKERQEYLQWVKVHSS